MSIGLLLSGMFWIAHMAAIQFESVSKVFKAHRNRPRSFQELVTSLGLPPCA
jgi:hypothetical protein